MGPVENSRDQKDPSVYQAYFCSTLRSPSATCVTGGRGLSCREPLRQFREIEKNSLPDGNFRRTNPACVPSRQSASCHPKDRSEPLLANVTATRDLNFVLPPNFR